MFIQTDYDKYRSSWVSPDTMKDLSDKVYLNVSGERGDLLNIVFTDTVEFAGFVDTMSGLLDDINVHFKTNKVFKTEPPEEE